MSVYALSFHANYACRHSGACCTAGWSIPVEPRLLPLLGVDLLVPDAQGTCVHFDRESRTFITLSNFCPTAATLLCASDAPLAIVPSPQAFPESRGYEGLDARGQWPPLVRPGLLFDLESYSRWERFIVSTLAINGPVDIAFTRIGAAAEAIRTWTPTHGSFDTWVAQALETPPADSASLARYERFRTIAAYETLRRFAAAGLAPSPPPLHDAEIVSARGWNNDAQVVRRYLASKAFASWSAYESRGIRTMVAELLVAELVLRVECERACRAAGRSPFDSRSGRLEHGRAALDRTLMIEAIRQSDLLLVHLIDRPRMIEWLGEIE